MLQIELPAVLEERLAALAQATGKTLEFFVLEALAAHLEEMENLHLAEKRLRDIRAGREGTVPLEEVAKRYGLDG